MIRLGPVRLLEYRVALLYTATKALEDALSIRRMASENPLWGQERIANELLLELGLRVSPRTVRKYMPGPAPGRPREDQRWSTFLRNHARAVIACDFFIAVTSTFRVLYVLVVIEHQSRRLIHYNVTAHPTAQWTRQQLREAVGYESRYAYLLHDRDSIFSADLDESVQRLRLRVLKSPPRSPKANAVCERVIGTIRRECLDWLIPLSEAHLRQTLKSWVAHYNRGRPHSALGPGVPGPRTGSILPLSASRHRLDDFAWVCQSSARWLTPRVLDACSSCVRVGLGDAGLRVGLRQRCEYICCAPPL